MACDEFYVVSLKWTKRRDNLVTLWGPNNSGYVFRLQQAGRYSKAQIEAQPSYYNNGESSIAVPCDSVDVLAEPVADVDSGAVDRDRDPKDLVVRYRHLAAIKRYAKRPS